MSDRQRSQAHRRPPAARARPAYGGPPPEQPHIGPIPITTTGVLIGIALIGSLIYLAFAISVRDTGQLPMLASGAVVLGIVFAAIAFVGARAAWRSSVNGRDARAFGHALLGGAAALVAAGCFAGAIVMFMVRNG